MNSTFEVVDACEKEGGGANGTFSLPPQQTPNKADCLSPPTNGSATISRPSRERQKTMVVENTYVSEARKIFANAKIEKEVDPQLERGILSLIQRHENSWNERLKEQHDSFELSQRISSHLQASCQKILDDLTSGEFVHKSSLKNGPGGGIGCMGQCDTAQKLKVDIQDRYEENMALWKRYDELHADFKRASEVINMQKAEYIKLHDEVLLSERASFKNLREKYTRLRANAEDQLGKASSEYEALIAKHTENTKGLRMRVRLLETEVAEKAQEIAVKDRKCAELKIICDQLMEQVEVASASDTDA